MLRHAGKLAKLKDILSGKTPIGLYLDFLYRWGPGLLRYMYRYGPHCLLQHSTDCISYATLRP